MRILVIEDDLKIAEALAYFLRSNNYVVDTACDGEQGLFLTTENKYGLIITDFILPKINGQELVRRMRTNGVLTPIIAISVCDDIAKKINFFESGVDDYLTKPFFFAELHARIKALLRRHQKINSLKLSFADLTLDLASHEVKRDGHSIYLTTKEFSLLQLLMEQPRLIHSKQIITEKIWDEASNHLSNVIEAHIFHLRHKIDFKKPFLIQTIPGRGYKLSLER